MRVTSTMGPLAPGASSLPARPRRVYHATVARPSLAPLVLFATLVGCAAGEADEDSNASFGGPGGGTPPAPPAGSTTGPGDPTGGTAETTGTTTRPPDPPDSTTDLPDTSDPTFPTSTSLDTTTADGTTTEPVVLCGNGEIDAPEECDGFNLNSQTCQTQGFTGGVIKCDPTCILDKSMCTSPSCGDGTVDMGEECDCGNQGASCTGPQLGNQTCGSLQSPNGSPYAGGNLTCNSPNSCSFNKAACTFCGDGIRNGGEACDGNDLGGQTCAGLGFSGGGSLSCSSCSFNTGGCVNMVCGDGVCQPGEDSCNCADCPDDPFSCSPCQCGSNGGGPCWCDQFCLQNGDCCANGPC
jgi:hypothetical protein